MRCYVMGQAAHGAENIYFIGIVRTEFHPVLPLDGQREFQRVNGVQAKAIAKQGSIHLDCGDGHIQLQGLDNKGRYFGF